MMKNIVIQILFFFTCHVLRAELITFQFYDQQVILNVDDKFWGIKSSVRSELDLNSFFRNAMINNRHANIVASLLQTRDNLKLNDWLYIILLEKICERFSPSKSRSQYLWFLLGQSGYKTSFAISNTSINQTLVYIHTRDIIYDFSHVGDKLCLNCAGNTGTVRFLKSSEFQNGIYACFELSRPPLLNNSSYIERLIEVPQIYGFQSHSYALKINETLVNIYSDYPNFELKKIVEVPFSIQAEPLLNKIDKFIHSLNDSGKVTYLMHFVSSFVKYREDKEVFNKDDKWMTPEEVLYFGTGDCEDNTSLLYSLILQLTNLPVILVDYPDIYHTNLAVSISNLKAKPDFYYKEKPFYVCETTTMNNSFILLGEYPEFSNVKYSIVGETRID